MGCLIRLALAVVVLGGLALAADGALAGQAERRASDLAGSVVGAPARVRMPGRPFVLHALRGSLPRVLIHAEAVPIPGTAAVVRRLELSLQDVRVSLGALLDGAQGRLPEAGAGTFSAVLDEAGLRALLGVPDELSLQVADGEIQVSVAGQLLAVTPEAREGRIVLAGMPDISGSPLLSGDLTGLPGGPWVERIEVAAGEIQISGSLRDL